MTDQSRCPVAHFDHNSPEHSADPIGSYSKFRSKHDIAWSEANGGYWVLAGYDAVFEAARNDDIFTSRRTPSGGDGLSVVIPKTPMHQHIPIELDPPEFRKYRKIVNLITAPAAVGRMTDMIAHYTTWFIDEVIEAGECDFSDIIGVPSIVTIDWLGIPTDEWRRYSSAHRATLASPQDSPEFKQAVEVDLPACSAQMHETIAARRENPTDDAISFLVQQSIDDRPITDDEVFSIVELLISGGVGTTASLVSQALVWLHQHHDARQKLIDDPSLLDHAVEEFLRYFSPTQALARTVTQDIEFKGCPMREGDRVLLSWASANRDEAAGFENPDELDIERWPNRHTAFGVGVHRCAGSHLGRAMACSLIGQILERMPDFAIDESKMQRYIRQGVNVGFRSLPATFTPGVRRSMSA
ncbi:cytochrome P450 [Rhodococcus sp. 14-2470-1a]|uniref:cytochrome P450 n=1 Tax=Rhodococcus sp. 14-2470-1a TaxID=2023150 RepID=UPI000B9BCFEA|nr:cytochrome P450 [Rhodococcus sp. 14-2470-1a]OZF54208.1 cytochrome P450 [Rhodococcus sp. 14-2470-1a]